MTGKDRCERRLSFEVEGGPNGGQPRHTDPTPRGWNKNPRRERSIYWRDRPPGEPRHRCDRQRGPWQEVLIEGPAAGNRHHLRKNTLALAAVIVPLEALCSRRTFPSCWGCFMAPLHCGTTARVWCERTFRGSYTNWKHKFSFCSLKHYHRKELFVLCVVLCFIDSFNIVTVTPVTLIFQHYYISSVTQ